ncbi:MAG: hypothetical protein EG823_09445 [Actinobacteria bacterium]|nr:hypothetical protein [Actinomycetota bacterium]
MRRAARVFLILVSILNGVAGLVCGVLFLVSPDGSLMGFEPLLSVIGTLPLADVFFRDLMWIGVAMLLVLAAPNTVAAVMLTRRSAGQYTATLAAGVLLVLWTGFELVFMYNVAAVGYFIVGVLSILCSVVLRRSTVQSSAQQAHPAVSAPREVDSAVK